MEVQVYAKDGNTECTSIPNINLESGEYVGSQSISIEADDGATIYYTLNGMEPSEKSNLYSKEIVLNPGNYTLKAIAYKDGKSVSGISQKTYTILDQNAIDYSKTQLEGCVKVGSNSSCLPTDIELVTYGGQSESVKVKWNSRNFTTDDMFKKVKVKGIVTKNNEQVTYNAMVIPLSDEYFITCNNTQSTLYDSVKKVCPNILNSVSDQKKETTNTWGYVKRGQQKSKTTNNEPWNTGYYNNSGNVEYTIHLPAGKHEVTIGVAGWWGNKYNLDVKYLYTGVSEQTLCNVNVAGNSEGFGSGYIELDKETDVTIKAPKVLSWIAVGKNSNDSEETNETTSFKDDTVESMKNVKVTNNAWVDLGVWQYMFNSWNNSNGTYLGGKSLDDFKVKITSSNWQEWGTQVKCTFNTVPGKTYKYKVIINANTGNGSYYFLIGESKQFLQLLTGENVIAGTYTATGSLTDVNFMIAYVGLNVEMSFSDIELIDEDGTRATVVKKEVEPEETTKETTTPEVTTTPQVTTTHEVTTPKATTTHESTTIPEITTTSQTTTKSETTLVKETTLPQITTHEITTTPQATTPKKVIASTGKTREKVKLGKVKIKSAWKKKKSSSAKISLTKVKRAKGYIIKISTSRKFKKKKTITINSRKIKFIVKRLKPNKKYYIKVRACYNIKKIRYYGKWSKVRKIKMK